MQQHKRYEFELRRAMVSMSAILLTALLSCHSVQAAQECSGEQRVLPQQITAPLSDLLSWYAFWYGPDAVNGYKVGMNVDATAMIGRDQLAVFIAPIGIVAEFRREEHGDVSGGTIGAIPKGASNHAAITEYLGRRALDESAASNAKSDRFARSSQRRPPQNPARAASQKHCEMDFVLQLPPSQLPTYIAKRQQSRALPRLLALVRTDLTSSTEACRERASGLDSPVRGGRSVGVRMHYKGSWFLRRAGYSNIQQG
jgi:hypothetical protein